MFFLAVKQKRLQRSDRERAPRVGGETGEALRAKELNLERQSTPVPRGASWGHRFVQTPAPKSCYPNCRVPVFKSSANSDHDADETLRVAGRTPGVWGGTASAQHLANTGEQMR